jgi:hypothetical protein
VTYENGGVTGGVLAGVEMAEDGTWKITVPGIDGSFEAGNSVWTEVVEPVYAEVIVTYEKVGVIGGVDPGVDRIDAGTLMMRVPEGSLPAGANVWVEVVKPL